MKKLIFASFIGLGLLAGSCGTNKSFNKKRHSHRNWVKVGEKVDSDFAQNEIKKTTGSESLQVAVVEEEVESVEKQLIQEGVVDTKVSEESAIAQNQKTSQQRTSSKKKAIVKKMKMSNFAKPLAHKKQSVEKAPKTLKPSIKNVPFKKVNDVDTIVLVIIAIFIAWLAVLLYEGVTTRFWISLVLWLLFILPGAIYAILVVTGTI